MEVENIPIIDNHKKMFVSKELLEDWKKLYLKSHTYPSTQTYYSFLKRFVGEGTIINQKNIDSFRENNMSSPSSGSLKSFCKFLVYKKGYPNELLNIRFEKNRSTKRFPKNIPFSDVEILINNMLSLKTKLLTRFLFECGLRISEALGIKWQDINYSEWLLNQTDYGKVNILKTKRGKFRTIPISPNLMKSLYQVSTKSSVGLPIGNLVFDFGIMGYLNNKEKLSDENLYDYMVYAENLYRKELYKISKTYLNKRISPHYLRHSRSQILLDSGLSLDSLKNFLGHSSISSTEIYASASSKKVKKELMEIDKKNQTEKQNKEKV